MSLNTWSPFQSNEVKAICEHLLPEEEKVLMRQAMRAGATFGLMMLPMSWIIGGTLLLGYPLASIGALIIGCIILTVVAKRFQKRNQEILCSTVWAQSQGIKPESLPMFRPLNRHS